MCVYIYIIYAHAYLYSFSYIYIYIFIYCPHVGPPESKWAIAATAVGSEVNWVADIHIFPGHIQQHPRRHCHKTKVATHHTTSSHKWQHIVQHPNFLVLNKAPETARKSQILDQALTYRTQVTTYIYIYISTTADYHYFAYFDY